MTKARMGQIQDVILVDTDENPIGNPTTPMVVDPELDKTAFGELLVAQFFPVFQQSFEYTVDNTDLTENTVVNGGTIGQTQGLAVVGTSTTTASTAMMESYRHAKYRAGIGSVARFTGIFTTPVEGTEQYIGLLGAPGTNEAFDNGYIIGAVGTTFGAHRIQNDVMVTVPLSECDDPLDGSGASGMVFDLTKLNVFEIRFQYLGSGAIQYCIEDDSTGLFVKFHTVFYANKFDVPSTYNPNFHFILWVNNKATTSDIVVKTGSFAYFQEGRTSFIETHQPQNSSGLRQKTSVQSEVAIFTIRNKDTYADKYNFIDIVIENVLAAIEAGAANNLGSIRVVKNTTLGGAPSYSDINTTDSVVEIDTSGTTLTGGKEVLVIPLAGKNDKDNFDVTPFRIFLKHGETLTIAGTSVASAIINSSILWRELF